MSSQSMIPLANRPWPDHCGTLASDHNDIQQAFHGIFTNWFLFLLAQGELHFPALLHVGRVM